MRLIFTILFFSVLSANAQTNYYVDSSKSDANDGLTPATAWKTLTKVDSYSATTGFNAGDSILLNRGDSWNDTLRIHNSGTSGSPIVVGAYGTGNKPLITGFQTLSGFVNTSGNIWTVTATNSVLNQNTVYVDGKLQAKGRYPNATAANGGYLTYSGGTTTSLTTSLTGTPNYTGVECVVRTASWILDVVKVSSQTTGTLNFASSLTYNPTSLGGNGFFFQNDSTFLDVQDEWAYDSATKRFQIYRTSAPSGVQISTIDTLIYVNGKNYITFDNLSITGANKAAFQFDSLSHITIQNCSINYSGTLGLSAQKCSYLSAINDSIQNSLSGAIYWRRVDPYTPTQDTCNYATISDCYIHNTAIYAGMGLSNNVRYFGIYVIGSHPYIYNNKIDSTGYVGIFFNGDTSLIENNFVSNFNFVKDDGGGIYTVVGSYIPSDFNNGSIIRKNVVINGIGAYYGVSISYNSPGIYLDNYSKNITVDSNSIYNCNGGALYLNEADSNIIRYNNVYDSIGDCFHYNGNNTYITAGGNQIKQNAFYSASSSYNIIYRQNGTNLGTIDSNYYSLPANETALNLNGTIYDLAGWQTATGKDLNSHGTPGLLSSSASFVYNPTQSDSTIYLTGDKISLRRVRYSGSITLQPFTSLILFNAIPSRQYQYKYYR